tara:strand:- start:68 stop:193 length:126 start_codon:yes stop_codon:yes gene_type:complete
MSSGSGQSALSFILQSGLSPIRVLADGAQNLSPVDELFDWR